MANNNSGPHLRTAEDVKAWCIRHAAQSGELWIQQKEWNHNVEKLCREISSKINTIDRRVMWMSGAAAGIGAVLGTVVTVFATHTWLGG